MMLLDIVPILLVLYHNAKIWKTIKQRLELNRLENRASITLETFSRSRLNQDRQNSGYCSLVLERERRNSNQSKRGFEDKLSIVNAVRLWILFQNLPIELKKFFRMNFFVRNIYLSVESAVLFSIAHSTTKSPSPQQSLHD